MFEVFVVQGEHPYDPYYPLEVFASGTNAAARCAELTRDFLEEVRDMEDPEERVPDVTVENWSEIVEKHASGGDMDGFGRWYVRLTQCDVQPWQLPGPAHV